MVVSSKVPSNFHQSKLLNYLSRRFTYLSREEWLRRFHEGRIAIGGIAPLEGSDTVLCSGDVVAYDLPDFPEPPADLNYRILYEDDWIIGVDKPGNLLVHKAGKSFRSNLVYHLRHCHAAPRYGGVDVINRLDRETSGVVLLAKDKNTLRAMNAALARREIRKEYRAVVRGAPPQSTWTVRLPISKDTTSAIANKFSIDSVKGKAAETVFETVERLVSGFSLIKAEPVTGRTHQIRVHCVAAGFPIVGDKLYGMSDGDYIAWRNSPKDFSDKLIFHRQALHCEKISFVHPLTAQEVAIEAELPEDMQQLIQKLRNLQK